MKKSKTIRVTGYVDDADAVYRKCDELCDRLNAENVRLDDAASFAKTMIDLVDKSRSVLDRHSAGLADPARLLGPSTEFLRPFEFFSETNCCSPAPRPGWVGWITPSRGCGTRSPRTVPISPGLTNRC